ncbi:twin arginine-targeting protein translocase TatB [Komagataeibacter nataicola]|uniref:Sec-independent protein translocase protein TatB n=1 Tax=Komagataeibacter nataicola TaxID=265960 RepID=A0A9N7H1J1_9PROT|nr:Sec-independent protein translocase protein TatB [Komagataeibacter nataicola]AQU88182.1 twin arginine-targeting protein translocase TatB [Komagataeibacter nataicola]PYD66012.1 twin-arginine translocase subunit TatB [Komagataeibacter nataicola]WEQ54714.1 Sec-independent protein translocase protein TatB [Komagataeibacter nataicola]GBR20107.1 Sec-independent protein translocase TatB [Komagataeibacter nataicola NRIC 0616]
MFDFAWSEFALIGVVGLLLIGPKDMPVAIRTVTGLIKKARGLATEFQSHVDEMVREADLTEARDQLGRLKRMNVRDKIMSAIDGDGALRRSLDDTHEAAHSAMAAPVATPASSLPEQAIPSRHYIPPLVDDSPEEVDAPDAPDFLPPRTARRIAAELPRLTPPAFLPPVRVIHRGQRVGVTPAGQE